MLQGMVRGATREGRIMTVPSKKGALEGLAAIISAVGGARTPVTQVLVEFGIFVGIVLTVVWAFEHGGSATKGISVALAFPGFFIGFFLLIRAILVLSREITDDGPSTGPKAGKPTESGNQSDSTEK
jgi:hypothetical protein